MSMRYIIRRKRPEKIDDLAGLVTNLGSLLGPSGEGFERVIENRFSSNSVANYMFVTRKANNEWIWVCYNIELVAENEEELLSLMSQFGVPKPVHLSG